MAGRIDDIRQRYDDFSQGDIEGATQDWADDFVWQGSNSTELPGGGEHKGKREALGVLQQAVGAWDEFTLSADEFFEDADTVVVLGHTSCEEGRQVRPDAGRPHLALGGRQDQAPAGADRHPAGGAAPRAGLRAADEAPGARRPPHIRRPAGRPAVEIAR